MEEDPRVRIADALEQIAVLLKEFIDKQNG